MLLVIHLMHEESNMNRWDVGRTVDVICQMRIRAEDAAVTEEYEGHTFYFCSVACHEEFAEDRPFFARLVEPVAHAGH